MQSDENHTEAYGGLKAVEWHTIVGAHKIQPVHLPQDSEIILRKPDLFQETLVSEDLLQSCVVSLAYVQSTVKQDSSQFLSKMAY